MKLESINSEKFALSSQEMGKLVGGNILINCTGAGGYTFKNGTQSSADSCYSYTGSDVVNGVVQTTYYFGGADDVAQRDAQRPCR
jgi:natural product precursor